MTKVQDFEGPIQGYWKLTKSSNCFVVLFRSYRTWAQPTSTKVLANKQFRIFE